jgi:hypothetical protein
VNVAEIFSKPEIAAHAPEKEPSPNRIAHRTRSFGCRTGNPAIGKRFGNPAKRDIGTYPAIRQLPIKGYSGAFAGDE